MSSTTQIRFAQKADIPLILEFIRALAEFEKLSHEVTATPELLEQFLFNDGLAAQVIDGPAAQVILAESQHQPVGFALFFTSFSTFLGKPGIYLEDLFVLPAHRSQGHGKRMLQYLARLTLEKNGGRLEWSVLDWNTRALKFYKSLGARPQNEWTVQRLTGEALRNLAEL